MKVFAFILSVAMLVGGAALADEPGNGDATSPVPISSAVKVCLAASCTSGHGSGVHIGDGWFLTAAHVADASDEFTLKAEDGRMFKASVVWISAESDLALMRVVLNRYQTFSFPSSAPVCRDPVVGENVTAIGNPHDILFAHVTGYITSGPASLNGAEPFYSPVSDPAKPQDIGSWDDAFIFVMPVFGGFSGGPVYDSKGGVLGLVVGMLTGTSYSVIEPLSKLCGLLPADVAVVE